MFPVQLWAERDVSKYAGMDQRRSHLEFSYQATLSISRRSLQWEAEVVRLRSAYNQHADTVQ